MSHPAFALIVAALAGGLIVYIFFATRPTAYDEPKYVYTAGVRVEQVSGTASARPRVLLAIGALLACLIFLARAVSSLV
jgi:hypothetical protein